MLEKLPLVSLLRGLGAAIVVLILAWSFGVPIVAEEITKGTTLFLLAIVGLVAYYIYETLFYKHIISRIHDGVRKIAGRPNHRMILKEMGASHIESMRLWGVKVKPHLKREYAELQSQGSIIHILYMAFFGLLVYALASETVPVFVIGATCLVLLVAVLMDVNYESSEAEFFRGLPQHVKDSVMVEKSS